jgi:predicted N-acetyltransferase YhbS
MIRTACEADGPAIRALMQSVPGFWQPSWRADAVERGVRSADGLAFVAVEEDRVVGFVCAHDVGFRGYLSELVVAEAARGRGIGAELVRRVEHELARRGCVVLISDVWRDAEGFYRRLGWSPPGVVLLRKRLDDGAS